MNGKLNQTWSKSHMLECNRIILITFIERSIIENEAQHYPIHLDFKFDNVS